MQVDGLEDLESALDGESTVTGEGDNASPSAGTESTSAASGMSKASGKYLQCNVCDSYDMPASKSKKQCKKHTRTLDTMLISLKEMDTKNGNTAAMDEFKQLRDTAPDHPPSAFASAVVEFEEKFPGKGRGAKRGHLATDVMQCIERHTASTQVATGGRMCKMHEEQWMHYATEVMRYPRPEAKALWDTTFKSTPAHMKDKKGPAHSPDRCWMPTEEYIDAATIMTHSKEVCVEGKRHKLDSSGGLEEAQGRLHEGHASFNNAMFEQVGGAAMASFNSGFSTTIPERQNVFAKKLEEAAAAQAAGKETGKKKKAPADLDLARNKILQKATEHQTQASAKVSKGKAYRRETLEEGRRRISGDRAVPGLQKFIEVVETRAIFLEKQDPAQVGTPEEITNIKPAGTTSDKTKTLDKLLALAKEAQLPKTVPVEKFKADFEEYAATLEKDSFVAAALVQIGAKSGVLGPTFAMGDVSAAILREVPQLRAHHILQDVLHQLVKEYAAQGKPIPVEEDAAGFLDTMFVYKLIPSRVQAADTEEQLKEIETLMKTVMSSFSAVEIFVKKACDEVWRAMKSHDLKTKAAQDKEAQNTRKEAEKIKKKQQAEVKGKEQAKGGQDILDLTHAAIQPMQSYESIEELRAKIASKSHKPKAYVVKSVPEAKLTLEDRSVKASLGVFRIQYPGSQMAKTQGTGQTPYAGDKKSTVREVLLAAAPGCASGGMSEKLQGSIAGKVVNGVSFFGTNPGTRAWALERQGMACVRFAVQGTREVIVTDFKSVADYAAKMAWMKPADADFFDWVSEVLNSIGDEEKLNVFSQQGGEFQKAVVPVEAALFVPFGSFVKERVLGNVTSLGVRVSVLDTTQSNLTTFEEMRSQYMSSLGGTPTALAKFWGEVSDMLKQAAK